MWEFCQFSQIFMYPLHSQVFEVITCWKGSLGLFIWSIFIEFIPAISRFRKKMVIGHLLILLDVEIHEHIRSTVLPLFELVSRFYHRPDYCHAMLKNHNNLVLFLAKDMKVDSSLNPNKIFPGTRLLFPVTNSREISPLIFRCELSSQHCQSNLIFCKKF